MPRPPFHLTDEQASQIAKGVMGLELRIPLDARSHRPFVREFIQLVYAATGKLYSPEIYRRLLHAYAPARRPSMQTLASEREHAARLSVPTAPAVDQEPALARLADSDWADRIAGAVTAKLAPALDTIAEQHNAQLDFYLHQLQQSDAELKSLRAHVATLGAQLAASARSAEQYRLEAESSRELLAKHVETIAQLNQNADDMRRFALISIEEARGEARMLKERCAELELQRQRDAQAMDSMRREYHRAARTAMKETDK